MGYSYDLGKSLKNIKDNKAATSLKKNKIINYPDSYMSNNLKHLGNPKNRFANRDYLLIMPHISKFLVVLQARLNIRGQINECLTLII